MQQQGWTKNVQEQEPVPARESPMRFYGNSLPPEAPAALRLTVQQIAQLYEDARR